MINDELRAYACAFVCYLVERIDVDLGNIYNIILYGSVAKNEANKESDIDIFMDTKNKNFEKKIDILLENFYRSKQAIIFKTKGISNKISVKVGDLRKWEDLHRSIMSTGIVLWGRYESKELPTGFVHKIIFSWDNVGINRGAFLNKIYGFKANKKKYVGMLENFDGKKIGKSSIILSVKNKEEFIKLFKKYKVRAKQMEVFVEN